MIELYLLQVWSLHALALIADSGGPMFRGYVEPSLSLALKLLLNVPQSYIDVHQCIGKVLSALITTVGPELQGKTYILTMSPSSPWVKNLSKLYLPFCLYSILKNNFFTDNFFVCTHIHVCMRTYFHV
jgi:hypothetical protein